MFKHESRRAGFKCLGKIQYAIVSVIKGNAHHHTEQIRPVAYA